ncbi:hypothetical protein FQR65_LT20294 [Abscondita terminalis]|nr:hypothetical protein FQR65_LT20294 [Abscondita terminalis]
MLGGPLSGCAALRGEWAWGEWLGGELLSGELLRELCAWAAVDRGVCWELRVGASGSRTAPEPFRNRAAAPADHSPAPDDVPSLSITELAEHGSCSEATVVRLCQSLGLRGYGELRLTLARRQATHIDLARGPIRGDEADHDVLVKTLGQAAQLLESVATHVSERVSDDFVRAVDALENAKDVLVIGIGASAAIAQDAAHQFQTIGLRAYAPADPFAQQFEAGRLGAGSVCFIVSHTGATEPVLRCAEIAGRAGATRVAGTLNFVSLDNWAAEIENGELLTGTANTLLYASFTVPKPRSRRHGCRACDPQGRVGELRMGPAIYNYPTDTLRGIGGCL